MAHGVTPEPRAMSTEPARRLHTLLHNGKDCWEYTDGETKRYYRLVAERFLNPDPVDWPARFRAAADAAESLGWGSRAGDLDVVARRLADVPPHVVEAIGRALLGEADQ